MVPVFEESGRMDKDILEESGRKDKDILDKVGSWKGIGWLKVNVFRWHLKVGGDRDSQVLTGNEFQTLGAENRKARDPSVKLWWRTESWWELDERKDIVGPRCCKRSERYGGRPVCKTLKVKVASLNRISHSIGSCLRSSFEESWDVREWW